MSLVVDASVALAWCFEDELSPYADAILEQLPAGGVVAPDLWALEVANGLFVARRRNRITAEQMWATLQFLQSLPVELHAAGKEEVFARVSRLADEHGLTVYDATYLELAERLSIPLATLDGPLRRAAQTAGCLHGAPA